MIRELLWAARTILRVRAQGNHLARIPLMGQPSPFAADLAACKETNS